MLRDIQHRANTVVSIVHKSSCVCSYVQRLSGPNNKTELHNTQLFAPIEGNSSKIHFTPSTPDTLTGWRLFKAALSWTTARTTPSPCGPSLPVFSPRRKCLLQSSVQLIPCPSNIRCSGIPSLSIFRHLFS